MSGVEDTPALRRLLGRHIGVLWSMLPETDTDEATTTLLDEAGFGSDERSAVYEIAEARAAEIEKSTA